MKQSIRLILLLFLISIHGLYAQKVMFTYVLNYQRLIQNYSTNELFSQEIAEGLNRHRSKHNTNVWGFGYIPEFSLSKNLSFSSGILFGRRAFRNYDLAGNLSGNAFYFSAPVTIKCFFNSRKIEPLLGLGFNNYLSLFSINKGDPIGVDFANIHPNMRKYTISALIQAGINIRINDASKFRIQFEFEQHLRSLTNGSVKLIPRAPGITVGYFTKFPIFDSLLSSLM